MSGGVLLAVALAGAAATLAAAGAERRPLPWAGQGAGGPGGSGGSGGSGSARGHRFVGASNRFWPSSGATVPSGATEPTVTVTVKVTVTVTGSLVVGWAVSGPVLAVVAGAVAWAGLRARDRWRRTAAATQERRRGIEACLAMAAELRAGRAVADALGEAAAVAVGATRVRLATAARVARAGGDVGAALRAPVPPVGGAAPAPRSAGAADLVPPAVGEALRALAACWQVSAAAGTGLADAVERLADGLVARAALDRAVQAELAGPRATAVLLAALPLPGLLLAAGLGADPLHVLLHTPVGAGCLLLGLALELLGLAWTRRLTTSVT